MDADAPHDPKIKAVLRELGTEGLGGLFLVWCHIADHGTRRPGWSLDSLGHPMPEAELMAISTLGEEKWRELVRICVSSGHFLKKPWNARKVIAIPAMSKRADTYTRYKLRSAFEESSNGHRSNFAHKTVHTKTLQAKKEDAPAARSSDLSASGTSDQPRRAAPDGRATPAASAPVNHDLLKKYGLD